MSAPLRITSSRIVKASATGSDSAKEYLQKLLKMVPGEAQSLFALGQNIIPREKRTVLLGWALFCLVVVIIVRVTGTQDRAAGIRPDWWHVLLSSMAFLLWLYTLGVILPQFNQANPYVSILVTAAFTFLVPYFYRGTES